MQLFGNAGRRSMTLAADYDNHHDRGDSVATHRRGIVAVLTNPAADNGHGSHASRKAVAALREACGRHGFAVVDITGHSRDESLENACRAITHAKALVVVGGDGMVSIGVNAVADCDVPLGIIACGSGNDFARGVELPIGRIATSAEGIAAALSYDSTIVLDLGHVRSPEDGGHRIDTFFAGMLNCSIDAAINDRANQSRLPFGTLRYLEAGIREATHVGNYGFHVAVTNDDYSVDDYDLLTPLLAIANAVYIGSGIQASSDSDLDDGLLEMLWAKWLPTAPAALRILAKAYRGEHLDEPVIGYRRIRSITISATGEGKEPPVLMCDGECIGTLPVTVDVHSKALRLLVPPAAREHWNIVEDNRHTGEDH
ncbi:diacylglycerol kinase [Bifidobacterium tissieri]|uniref:Diacylglycerol kinase n=2 Tax=Bifidobacterium tissieri TaxID=1630162 RepID=A0A5M9ZIP3_9BIFI|nr:diacylglycerol kinase [Bifidobacterium tissieri]KAA8830556.1 diacylglycerol kinase [Bifidobacterium tissieri]